MLIYHNPDDWKTVFESRTCDFHKRNPGKAFAGCTCMCSVGVLPITAEERELAREALEASIARSDEDVDAWADMLAKSIAAAGE